jgi:hypothetical protein
MHTSQHTTTKWTPQFILLVIGIVVVVLFTTAYAVMVVWNLVLPDLFHTPRITFWQAFGLTLLSHLLMPARFSSK